MSVSLVGAVPGDLRPCARSRWPLGYRVRWSRASCGLTEPGWCGCSRPVRAGGSQRMSQRVHGDTLARYVRRWPPRARRGSVAGYSGDQGITAREQISAGQHLARAVCVAPPGAQAFEQDRRQQCVTILLALALLDAQQHALTIDIRDLQGDDFANTQPCAIRDR